MDPDVIEREIRRLSPWYYKFDLGGVSTDITPPSDHHGHRIVRLPDVASGFLRDRTVLDVGCNEGGYTFAALDHGARYVSAFDVRDINIEKARFVASVLRHTNVTFQVASCDSWLEGKCELVDYVFMCGLLYHLTDPPKTIRQYAGLADKGVFVTCVLAGGTDGYTPFPEAEGIGASEDPSEVSQMPNTTRTILREFEKHGFQPAHIAEDRTPSDAGFWGGCSVVFVRCERESTPSDLDHHEEFEFHLLQDSHDPQIVDIVLYSWLDRPIDVRGRLRFLGATGEEVARSVETQVALPARVSRTDGSSSSSTLIQVRLKTTTAESTISNVEATLLDLTSDRILARKHLALR